MDRTTKTIIFWIVIMVSALLLWRSVKAHEDQQNAPEISYSQFLAQVESESVVRVKVSEISVEGTSRDGSSFRVSVPRNQDQMVQTLQQKGVEIWYAENHKSTTDWITNLAPLGLLAVLWFFMIRRMSARTNRPPTVPPGNAPWPGN